MGEYPKAAATLGINVVGVKYAASVICGALAGIGGAYLTTCYSTTYTDGNVAGRGFIALAAVIFGRWSAGGVLLACLFFGFCDAITPPPGGQLRHPLSVLSDDPLHRHRGGADGDRHEKGGPQGRGQALSPGTALNTVRTGADLFSYRSTNVTKQGGTLE